MDSCQPGGGGGLYGGGLLESSLGGASDLSSLLGSGNLVVTGSLGLLEGSLSAVEDGLGLSGGLGGPVGLSLTDAVLLEGGGVDALSLGGTAARGRDGQG